MSNLGDINPMQKGEDSFMCNSCQWQWKKSHFGPTSDFCGFSLYTRQPFLHTEEVRCYHKIHTINTWLSCNKYIFMFFMMYRALSCKHWHYYNGEQRGIHCVKWPAVIVLLNWTNNHQNVPQHLGRASLQLKNVTLRFLGLLKADFSSPVNRTWVKLLSWCFNFSLYLEACCRNGWGLPCSLAPSQLCKTRTHSHQKHCVRRSPVP